VSLSQSYSTLDVFDPPLSTKDISFIPTPLIFSPADSKRLREYWDIELKVKQTLLLEKRIDSVIKTYEGVPEKMNALYVNGQPVMWPGNAITLRNWSYAGNKLSMDVSELSYPFIGALSNPDFRDALSDQSFIALRPPLAICTFAITTDNFLVLTVRGMNTNVYPGRYYGQGGNPTSCVFDLTIHQVEEMTDELNIDAGDISQESFRFSGIAEDSESFPGKPDLIGWVRLRIDAETLQSKFSSRPMIERPPDAAGLRLVRLTRNSLANFLQNEVKQVDFCPPALCGLHMLATGQFLES
jgi:hypothetical protein